MAKTTVLQKYPWDIISGNKISAKIVLSRPLFEQTRFSTKNVKMIIAFCEAKMKTNNNYVIDDDDDVGKPISFYKRNWTKVIF